MNDELLLDLARDLRTLPKPLWDFGDIMRVGDKEPEDAFEAGGGCGTTGCAIGWAPSFMDWIEWRKDYDGYYSVHHHTCTNYHELDLSCDCLLSYFDIDGDEFRHLFVHEWAHRKMSYDEWRAEDVARHIELFVYSDGECFHPDIANMRMDALEAELL